MEDKSFSISDIKVRKSVRSYKDVELEKNTIDKINDYINNIENPFGEKVRIKLISGETNQKLGTYGVIKGAKMYLAAACENGEFDLEALGYEFEKVILYATKLGLGTCWLGGTFNKGSFAKAMEVKENEKFPIVSPIGYESSKKYIIESIVKFGAKSSQRKDFNELFFSESFGNTIEDLEDCKYLTPLEMIRIAPSALNAQPWRVILKGKRADFYKTNPSRDMNKIDMGIALAHFHVACEVEGIEGRYEKVSEDNITQNDDYEYVISWIENI